MPWQGAHSIYFFKSISYIQAGAGVALRKERGKGPVPQGTPSTRPMPPAGTRAPGARCVMPADDAPRLGPGPGAVLSTQYQCWVPSASSQDRVPAPSMDYSVPGPLRPVPDTHC